MQHIYIGDEGKGFPLVLVHGFLGSSKMWEPQINFFKDRFRVITPDLPGFGKSNKAKSYNNINLMAQTVLDCLKEKSIEKFYLLGHSMGGMIVQEMVKIAGEKTFKLVCYGTGAIGNIPGRFETMDESRSKLKKMGLEKTVYRIAKTWFVEEDRANYFHLCLDAGKATSLEAADNALIAMKTWRGIENLKNINNKTLIVWGDKDKAYNLNQIEILKNNIPNSELKIFKNCSHNVHLEIPDKFNQCIDDFLKK